MNLLLALVVALLVMNQHVEADFMYNRILPKEDQLEKLGLKCIPGRTVIRMEEKKAKPTDSEEEEEEETHSMLRTHMNAVPKNENCQICVCSVEGKDEYCSRRPARNVNECIRMSLIKDELKKNLPYSHERSLAYRIRRDYIWHDDEIPYEAKASCRRGRSYYSNSINASYTDIDVGSDVDSLLDYSNKDICFYCVCSLDGKKAGCIRRDPTFCEYFRQIRYPQAARDYYWNLFEQDRPAYFRQLSYRLRRKMDEGIFDLMEHGGDALCCDHPDGHRRQLHENVRNKIRLMRRKVPKENILSGSPGVGTGLDAKGCVPYISQYTDCTDANACSGCTRCSCNENGQWECSKVFQCPREDSSSVVDDSVLENALGVLFEGLDRKRFEREQGSYVPTPPNPDEDLLLVPDRRAEMEDEIRTLMGRHKRSVTGQKKNTTVKFYETVDEINEDTLRDLNSSGTIEAQKVDVNDFGKKSRTNDVFHNSKKASNISDLHIEYNQPHNLEHHIAENKIDSKHLPEDKINGLSHHEIHKILGNYSQIFKDKDLSKVVVNELTRGTERIGDKTVVPVSNITFTPENDTLTAMTFIAGNLLNKLWDLEKDATEGSYETENLKHEKLNDLLELFKEPLSLRQEYFLKNALKKLSHAIDTNKESRNVSVCAYIDDPETDEREAHNCTDKSKPADLNIQNNNIKKTNVEDKAKNTDTINKITEVLNLIKKYEHLQKQLKHFKTLPEFVRKSTVAVEENMTHDEKVSLNLFGSLLDKITKLLSPNRNSKKITERIQTYNMLRKDDIVRKNIEKLFNINLDNIAINSKDKMITDYLNNIEKHPNCFFTHLQNSAVTPLSNMEGNILYNLSEFFKIKSFSDLLKIVNDKSEDIAHHTTTSSITLNYPSSTIKSNQKDKLLRSHTKSKTGSLELAKEKLKNDVKTILKDLLELQKEHGIKTKNNINIADVLPCMYNILKAENSSGDISKNEMATDSVSKIKSFIDSLRLDMKFMSNRRFNTNIHPRPKSAVVWERAIKNLNKKYQQSRRNLGESPKTYEELRELIDKVEVSSNTYKNFALQSGVAPSEKLILLKALQADNKQYTTVLETIQKSLDTISNLPLDKQNEFSEFIDNAVLNINLNKKLLDHVTKFKESILETENTKPEAKMFTEFNQPMVMMPKRVDSSEINSFKLNRDQIMNQLIQNRLKIYIKTKERTENDLNANANYNIAKRILFHLENGNIALAKELYKVFLANKQHPTEDITKMAGYHDLLDINKKEETRRPKLMAFQQPLVRVEDPKKIEMLNQDYFLKQLWNLKEMKE